MKKMNRRQMMAAAAAAGVATIGAGSSAALARENDFADIICDHDHQRLGYRLGAHAVDPALDDAARAMAMDGVPCPGCGTAIEPDGLAWGIHMAT